jgi:hypothetical protein
MDVIKLTNSKVLRATAMSCSGATLPDIVATSYPSTGGRVMVSANGTDAFIVDARKSRQHGYHQNSIPGGTPTLMCTF